MVGSFGSTALAAHTAVNQLFYIVFQVSIGLSHAASLGVSRELALGRTDTVRRTAHTALACAVAVTAVVAVAYSTAPGLVLRPFFDGAIPHLAAALLLLRRFHQGTTTRVPVLTSNRK